MKDLLTGEAFKRDDIITLQDPKQMDRRNMANAWFVQKGLDKKGKCLYMCACVCECERGFVPSSRCRTPSGSTDATCQMHGLFKRGCIRKASVCVCIYIVCMCVRTCACVSAIISPFTCMFIWVRADERDSHYYCLYCSMWFFILICRR